MIKGQRPIGIIGAGRFGSAIANLIAKNREVLLFTRSLEKANRINSNHLTSEDIPLHNNIVATTDIKQIATECYTIFPIVPSRRFRRVMQDLSPYLRPHHFIIHGTKGFALNGIEEDELYTKRFSRENISLMSEVISQESSVIRIGCISGPNLAKEILEGLPAGTVVASPFDEVITEAQMLLNSDQFRVFGSHDLIGTELAGALKNIIALGSGILGGLKLGKNAQALLITKGLGEMIYFGNHFGADSKAFIGTAGIGDLIATAMSKNSRNYKAGIRLGQGESLTDIQESNDDLIEGLRTLIITYHLSRNQKIHLPIIQTLYRVIYGDFSMQNALKYLMAYPFDEDVDFLD